MNRKVSIVGIVEGIGITIKFQERKWTGIEGYVMYIYLVLAKMFIPLMTEPPLKGGTQIYHTPFFYRMVY